jgi:hypothetical protein
LLSKLYDKIEDQRLVYFTGKLNLLYEKTKQLYAQIYFIGGEVVNVECKGVVGLKGFYSLCINMNDALTYIIEPELISADKKKIHYSYEKLKQSFNDVEDQYREAMVNRPPNSLKMSVNANFIVDKTAVSNDEFELLCCLSDYNLVEDIYKYCRMLDYQITNALISLRKKKALKVIQIK